MDAPTSYIPQRHPFVMIGDLISADGKTTKTTFTISPDNIFVSGGLFTEAGLIENMAQTAGAGTGYVSKNEGKPMPGGYIAALKNVAVHALPKVNDTITTETTFLQNLMNFHLVTARISCNGQDIATSEFKIFVNTTHSR